MPNTDYPLPYSGDRLPACPARAVSAAEPPIVAWIDEPASVRLIVSMDGVDMPVIEIEGGGHRIHIGLDPTVRGGSPAARMLRAVVEAYERHERLTHDIERAAGVV